MKKNLFVGLLLISSIALAGTTAKVAVSKSPQAVVKTAEAPAKLAKAEVTEVAKDITEKIVRKTSVETLVTAPPTNNMAVATLAIVKDPTVAIVKTSMGTFTIKLLKDKAPNTCRNFVKLSRKGFYNNLTFHRIIPNFMIQGGCPFSKVDAAGKLISKGRPGTGDPGYKIKAEFNDTKHVPGIVSMARSSSPDSAGSQFFICVAPAKHLDGKYTAFGKVILGYNIVQKISKVKTSKGDMPVKPVIIKSITLK